MMSTARPLVSIVAPAYNEEAVIGHFHQQLLKTIDPLSDRFDVEVIYVDDGSSDSTPALLADLAANDFRVRYAVLSRNFGHQAALTAGLERARGDVIISMDSDLQHPPELIPVLLEHWEAGSEIVLTIRQDHASLGFFKKLTSRLFYRVMRSMSGMDIRPAASDFRLMSRKALNALLAMPERHRFLRGMVHWLGFRRTELPFHAPPRFAGKSKYTLVRMIRLARDGLLSFSRVPLHAALVLAGMMLMLSAIGSLVAWAVWRPEGGTGWLLLALIGAVHLAGGAVWIALLAFSEYLARVHEQVLGRPLYVVRESSDIREGVESQVHPNRERTAA